MNLPGGPGKGRTKTSGPQAYFKNLVSNIEFQEGMPNIRMTLT